MINKKAIQLTWFGGETSPVYLVSGEIKDKDIKEMIEVALDKGEDEVNVFEGLMGRLCQLESLKLDKELTFEILEIKQYEF